MNNTSAVQSARIPVIDICSKDTSDSAIAQELLDAAIYNGFVYLKNKGQDIPISTIDHIFECVRSQRSVHTSLPTLAKYRTVTPVFRVSSGRKGKMLNQRR